MSVFGSNPIDPRGPQASLAAQTHAKATERTKPVTEATQRMKDAAEQRVAGAESESAVRRVADEHDDSDAAAKRQRRDGRRDRYQASVTPTEASEPQAGDPKSPPEPGQHLDVRA